MRNYIIKLTISVFVLVFLGSCVCEDKTIVPPKAEYDIAAYVWPAYQTEPRWKELGIFGDGKGEWQNVYEAKSKRKGHVQPLEPLWGYEMDDDPVSMEKQINAATKAGINVFVYDWYWYGGRPFL
ncbi:MAG: glycoside hydrolase family 99-like domain-containing protein, partial [Opitutales bacterium]|nr:glycoside hydrolase family 99-like domain-containing protein [Opitutales bacterium]